MVQQVSGSYALAGAAVGADSAAIAVSAPLRGRLLDRHGPRRVLPPLVAAHALAIAALPVAAVAGSGWLLVALATLTGLTSPAFAAAMRVEWQALLGRDSPLLERAYALETSLQISAFIFGALVSAALIASVGARGALAVSAALTAAGGVAFVRHAAAAGTAAQPGPRRSPIRRPGVLTLVLATALADVGLGAIDVGVTAFAQLRGEAWVAGVLLAIVTASSAVGAIAYGARSWRAPASRRLIVTLVCASASLALLALADSVGTLALLLVLAGPPAAAQWSTVSVLLDRVAPAGAGAEAFNWLSTANACGFAAGGLAAGIAVDSAGPAAAFLAAGVSVALAAVLVTARRGTLAPTPR